MKLSKKLLNALHRYETWKDTDPSFTHIVTASWRRYVYVIAVIGGCTIFLWWGGWKVFAALFVGYILGVLYGDFQRFIVTKKFWPIHREIMDWAKVRSIIEENESKNITNASS